MKSISSKVEPSAMIPTLQVFHKSRLMVMLAAALLLCAMAGCDNSQADLVGKWSTAGQNAMVWEFFQDNSVMMGNTRGKYTLGRNRVKIQTPFGTNVYQLDLSGDRLVLTAPEGTKLLFTRSK